MPLEPLHQSDETDLEPDPWERGGRNRGPAAARDRPPTDRERLIREREAAEAERDRIARERDDLVLARFVLRRECDALAATHSELERECDRLARRGAAVAPLAAAIWAAEGQRQELLRERAALAAALLQAARDREVLERSIAELNRGLGRTLAGRLRRMFGRPTAP